MAKKPMDGGYGYLMSNKITKDITTSVLQNKSYKADNLANEYNPNSKSAINVSMKRSSVVNMSNGQFANQTYRRNTNNGQMFTPSEPVKALIPKQNTINLNQYRYSNPNTRPLSKENHQMYNDQRQDMPNLFSNNFLRKSQIGYTAVGQQSQNKFYYGGNNGNYQTEQQRLTSMSEVNSPGPNNRGRGDHKTKLANSEFSPQLILGMPYETLAQKRDKNQFALLAGRNLSTPKRNQLKQIDQKKLNEYDEEFEKNMQSIEIAQKRLQTKMHDKNKHQQKLQMMQKQMSYESNHHDFNSRDNRWDMFENTGMVVGKNIEDERYSKPSLINSINKQLNLGQDRASTFKGPNINLQQKNTSSLGNTVAPTQRYNYESRVLQAHRELQNFFQKFENDAEQGENADSRCSRLKNSFMDDAFSEKEDLTPQQQKVKSMISAKTMLEQRKRALTHNKRMQNYNQQNVSRRQTVQEAKKQNAFVLYDLKNIEMLQNDSDSSDKADNSYAFDFSDDEEREIQEEKKEKKLSKEEQDKIAQEKLGQFQIIRLLGQGAYAQVKLAQNKETKQRVAIKIYPKYKLDNPIKRNAVKREIMCMKKLNHPYVCKLYDNFESSKDVYLVQEYVSGISLYQYMRNKGSKALPLDRCRFFIKQMCECIKYLHSASSTKESIVHRDLKLENIIVDDRNNIKLIDFGFAVQTYPGQKLKTWCGTPSYMPPELCQKREYCGYAADVWSLGVIFFVLLIGNMPFKGVNEKDLFAKVARCMYRIPESLDFDAKRMLQKILVLEPGKRPRCGELQHDRFLCS